MKKLLLPLLVTVAVVSKLAGAQFDIDPAKVDVYMTPFYNSAGPEIQVGPFSAGLASKDEKEFLATIAKMKSAWSQLSFAELYVAAIRLYDLGYRKESVYWFYSAQFRGRQFGTLLEQSKAGGLGSAGFELFQAQNSFYQLAGPFINGYAFGDITALIKIVERVQKECRSPIDMEKIYPGVTFIAKNLWKGKTAELADGMGGLVSMLREKREDIKKQREAQGIEAKFAKLQSKDLPKAQ
jgi:hypothetical protein